MKPRLLADENFPIPSVRQLRKSGFDVLAVSETSPGISDAKVLALATSEQRILITFDCDYGELVFSRKVSAPPAIFLFRLKSYRPESPGNVVVELLSNPERYMGQFVLIADESLRVRPLPLPQ